MSDESTFGFMRIMLSSKYRPFEVGAAAGGVFVASHIYGVKSIAGPVFLDPFGASGGKLGFFASSAFLSSFLASLRFIFTYDKLAEDHSVVNWPKEFLYFAFFYMLIIKACFSLIWLNAFNFSPSLPVVSFSVLFERGSAISGCSI